MIKHQGVFLPDGETHLVDWMNKAGEEVDGRGTYQIKKLREALKHVKNFRTAIDVGAHCGLWSMQLAKRFAKIHAFEPVEDHRACYAANMPGLVKNYELEMGAIEIEEGSIGRIDGTNCIVHLHNCALGDHEDQIKITTAPTSSGDSRVDGPGGIPMHTLDSFGLTEVDFLKMDTEGYELFVVRGAEQTIKACQPTIIIEQKGHGMQFYGFRKEEGAELLESWGYKRVANMSGDIILVPQ